MIVAGCSSNRGRYSNGHYIERDDGLYEYADDYDNYNDYPDPYEMDGISLFDIVLKRIN